jgi:SM-20-related protein
MPLPNEPAPTAPDEIAGALADPGYVVVPHFLDEATGLALLAEIRASRERGDLHEAAVGRGGEKQVRSEIRSDHVLWLDPAALSPAQSRFWEALETVRASLNRELFLGLFDLEAHLACYPPGAYYKALPRRAEPASPGPALRGEGGSGSTSNSK